MAAPLALVVAVGSAVVGVKPPDVELPAGITFPEHLVSIWQPIPAGVSFQARCVDCHWVGPLAVDHQAAWASGLLHGNTA